MTAPVFGHVPNKRNLQLSDGADFILNLVLQGGAVWPDDTELRIELGPHPSNRIWYADVDGGVVTWKIESTETDKVLADTPYRMYVRYPDGTEDSNGVPITTDLLWFLGKVKRTR